jgi:hypothetical protein
MSLQSPFPPTRQDPDSLPSVSVVIPCYNAESHVRDAVASVQAQTHPPIEIICVNDGSTDRTLEVLRRLSLRDARIHVIDGPNEGAAVARNRGIVQARGTYLQFLDADDVLRPQKLGHQLRLAARRDAAPDLIFAAFDLAPLDGGDENVEYGPRSVHPDPWVGAIRGMGAVDGCGTTSSNLWRREAVAAVGGMRPSRRFGQDILLLTEMLLNGATPVVDSQRFTTVRIRPDSLRTTGGIDRVENQVRLLTRVRHHLMEIRELTPERDRLLYRRLMRGLGTLHHRRPQRARALCKRAFPSLALRHALAVRGLLYTVVWRTLGLDWAESLRWRQERFRRWVGAKGA